MEAALDDASPRAPASIEQTIKQQTLKLEQVIKQEFATQTARTEKAIVEKMEEFMKQQNDSNKFVLQEAKSIQSTMKYEMNELSSMSYQGQKELSETTIKAVSEIGKANSNEISGLKDTIVTKVSNITDASTINLQTGVKDMRQSASELKGFCE